MVAIAKMTTDQLYERIRTLDRLYLAWDAKYRKYEVTNSANDKRQARHAWKKYADYRDGKAVS